MQVGSWVSRVHLDRAARAILAGGVVAYPTEAVYGLGCIPGDRAAVERLLAIKRRSWRKGLALIGADLAQLQAWISMPTDAVRADILAGWPGPVTWILPARPGVPSWLTGGRDTVAVRVTDHPVAAQLCRRTGCPLVSTSANRSGRPPLRRALHVRREFGAELDDVLAGPLGGLSRPTMIRDGRTGVVLRPS